MIERVRSSAMFLSCITSVGKAFHCTAGTTFALAVPASATGASAAFPASAAEAATPETTTAAPAAPTTIAAAATPILAVEGVGADVAERRLQRIRLLRSRPALRTGR